jgi:hypothetical protein
MRATKGRMLFRLALLAAWLWAFAPAPNLLTAAAQQQPQRGSTFDGYGGEFTGAAAPPEEPLSLWYRRPAKEWVEALAVGNGRLGAMVFGGVTRERKLRRGGSFRWDGR